RLFVSDTRIATFAGGSMSMPQVLAKRQTKARGLLRRPTRQSSLGDGGRGAVRRWRLRQPPHIWGATVERGIYEEDSADGRALCRKVSGAPEERRWRHAAITL